MDELPWKSYIIVILCGFMVSLIPLLLAEQPSTVHSIVSTFMILFWFLTIFIMGVPKLRIDFQTRTSENMNIIIILGNLFFTYLLLLLFGSNLSDTVIPYLFWYLLPTFIFIASIMFTDQLGNKVAIMYSVGALIFWIGFDHRYTDSIFDTFTDLSYIMNAFWIASLLMTSYGYNRSISQNTETDVGLKPSIEGLKLGQIASILVSLVIVPAGLLTGFLSWNPNIPSILDIIVAFIGIFLTIALQEELIFRGVLLQEADIFAKKNGINHLAPILLTSFLFGLTHWNNEILQYVPHYIILATIAGIAYGWAYRKGGMFAAMITHTLVDWIWSMILLRA